MNTEKETGEIETGTVKKAKRSGTSKQLILIISIAALAVVLIIAYFAFIKPALEDKSDGKTELELIWKDEVNYANTYVMMFEHIQSDNIESIKIHNPKNAEKYGGQYVDWGVYRYRAANDPDNKGYEEGDFYLTGFEFAPYDQERLSELNNAAGMTITTARVEDHCDNYAKYGLAFENEEDAMYFVITSTSGKSYKAYIGDRLPSGNGYYARVAGSSVELATGEEKERDSVYIFANSFVESTLMSYPATITDTYITLPLDFSAVKTLDYFLISDIENATIFEARPNKSTRTDPFALFAGSSIYYTVEPKGYYGSTAFEELATSLAEFKGSSVVELATPQPAEDGGEDILGFTDEQLAKYQLDQEHIRYAIIFRHNGIDNEVYFSDLIDGSYYYAWSLVMNTILKVDYTAAPFLRWTHLTYINTAPFGLSIYNCESISVTGTYDDPGIDVPERKGVQNVDESFRISGTQSTIVVTNLKTGENITRQQFSKYYLQLLYMNLREELEEEEVKRIMEENDPCCTLTVATRTKTIYKQDNAGNDTTEVERVLPSVKKIYRFYRYTAGRALVTIESVDGDGNSLGEVGSYYMMASKVDQILASALSLVNGIPIEGNART